MYTTTHCTGLYSVSRHSSDSETLRDSDRHPHSSVVSRQSSLVSRHSRQPSGVHCSVLTECTGLLHPRLGTGNPDSGVHGEHEGRARGTQLHMPQHNFRLSVSRSFRCPLRGWTIIGVSLGGASYGLTHPRLAQLAEDTGPRREATVET